MCISAQSTESVPRKGEIIEAVKTSVTQKRIVETKYPSIEKKIPSGVV